MQKQQCHQAQAGQSQTSYETLRLTSYRGETEGRYYAAIGAQAAVIWVGGIGGGWDSPAHGVYKRLSETLSDEGIASLRVRFRYPGQLEECVSDVLAGIDFLTENGIKRVLLGGHSFGGAVVVLAAQLRSQVQGLALLATQSLGTESIGKLPQDVRTLVLHGQQDKVLSPACSQRVFEQARRPKRLRLYEKAHHNLDEVDQSVFEEIYAWVIATFKPSP